MLRKDVRDNRQLFHLLPREKVSVTHGHCNFCMTQELLYFNYGHLARLGKPRGKRMAHGVQGNSIKAVPLLGIKPQTFNSLAKTSRGAVKRHLGAWLLENRLGRCTIVRQKHGNNIFGNSDRRSLATFLYDVKHFGIGVYVLPLEPKHFRRPQTCSQGKQNKIVQLLVVVPQIVKQQLGLILAQKAQPLVVFNNFFPNAASCGQRIGALPYTGSNGAVNAGPNHGKCLVDGSGGNLFEHFAILCIVFSAHPILNNFFRILCAQSGKNGRRKVSNRDVMHCRTKMQTVLSIRRSNGPALALHPFPICFYRIANGEFADFYGVDPLGHLGKEFGSGISCGGCTHTGTVPAHSFPVPFAIGVRLPKTVDAVIVAGLGIPLGRFAVKDALKLRFDVFSAFCVAHGATLTGCHGEGKKLIQNLSKKILKTLKNHYNYLYIFNKRTERIVMSIRSESPPAL